MKLHKSVKLQYGVLLLYKMTRDYDQLINSLLVIYFILHES